MNVRKKIALLVGQPDENYQSLFIRGFLKQSFLENMDVCIFAMYEKYQESEKQGIGDSSIFSLMEYSIFDAIVVLADTVQTPGVIEELEEDIHNKYDGKVIFVDKESKYFYTVMTDHYTPVKQLIKHLIREHGFTDIAYLTGKEFHPHSKQRLQGFLDCMEENGLTIGENRVFYGDFWYTSGMATAEKLLADKEHLPQAVACANDCMAIGVAQEMVKAGVRVPEDIAIVGYDMSPEGKTSPKPVTSAPIPSEKCGAHVIKCLRAFFAGREMPEFNSNVKLFIGSSCGCRYNYIQSVNFLRDSWETESYQDSFYSTVDRMEDNLLLQPDSFSFFNTVYSYTGAVKPFDALHICLNIDWLSENKNSSVFSDYMIHAINCSEHASGTGVDLDDSDSKGNIISNIVGGGECGAYFFTPLYFEDRCYGFSAVSYGQELRCYDKAYRQWLGSIMRGLEVFKRTKNLEKTNEVLKTKQVRDSLTGFYNYNGFIENINTVFSGEESVSKFAEVIAIDLVGMNEYYQNKGLSTGNKAIVDFSNMIAAVIGGGISCVLGNGEFLAVYFNKTDSEENAAGIQESLRLRLSDYCTENDLSVKLDVVTGRAMAEVENIHALEDLINEAISIKNGNKVKMQRNMQNKLTGEEQKEAELVADILDNNRLFYHFQPIVDAHTGEIFAYEALMRADTEQFISPLTILKYAEYLGRLRDVQWSTFINVISFVEENEEKFKDKKIFINSIPGCHLVWQEEEMLRAKIGKYAGRIVVELTEQAEVDDASLAEMKNDYSNAGVETAVDDYGTGYSNITNLLRYMPNYVKIDRMLLTDIHLSLQKQHFVKEIIEFSHDNQITVLAEGVETPEELKAVITLGADLIQGFYTAKPAREVISGIDNTIRHEIIQYSQAALEKSGQKVYAAGQESKINLVKLAANNFSSIQIKKENLNHRDLEIIGVPGFKPDMDIIIGDGYKGRIELNDVELNKHKNHSGIFIGENCDVTLVLKGDNILERGGIIVPESSKLTIKGNGNICMRQIEIEGCGIGNTINERHGDLYFEQDGAVEIYGNTMHGVGIGSGMGGNIYINRGKYVIDLYGQEAVGIGTFQGDFKQEIHTADIELNIQNAISLGIGSMEGNVDVKIWHVSIKAYFGGQESVGIGTLRGKGDCNALIKDSVAHLNLRANEKGCCYGSLEANTDLDVSAGVISVVSEGKQAISMGSLSGNARIQLRNTDTTSKVKNNLDTDIIAESMEIINGRSRFSLNGEEIEREITDGEL